MPIIILIFAISSYAEKAYLLPSRNGEPSEIKILRKTQNINVSTPLKNKSKGVLKWLEYNCCNYHLYAIEDVDTFMVWFVPPAPCSILVYEVTNICDEDPNQQRFTMFLATLDQSIDYANDFPEYHACPPPSSHRGFATVVQSLDTFAWGADSQFTVTKDTLINPIDNGLDIFGSGWVKARGDSSPQPPIQVNASRPYHTLMYRDTGWGPGWYSSFYNVRVRALVNLYENPPPKISIEDLPDTYTHGQRNLNIYTTDFGVPFDSAGVAEVTLEYQVNGGIINEITCNQYSGDSTDGYWKGDIPAAVPGDTVVYWGIATDFQGASDTSEVYSYIIREGNLGNFLFVDNDYTESNILPDYWIDTCDVWNYDEYGMPDSSVLTFYNTIVWRDWWGTALGKGIDYGAGIYHSDTSWIKMLLNNGGNFWLSAQDQGYGFGICPDYGQYDVPAASWVQQYLGIQGMYDDPPLLGGTAVTAYGNPSDTIIGDLFAGIGLQTAGQVYIAPYYYLTGNFAYAYTGSFDSLQSGAVINMLETSNDLVISYRYEGPGGSDYKVYNDFWPWDYIAKPGYPDTLDLVAIDSLVSDVLGWFGYTSGVSDRTLDPEKVIRLLLVGIVTKDAMIRFYLPEEKTVNLSIYDKTGRLIRKLIDEKAKAGLNTVRWNGKDSYGNPISSGVYFYQLKTGDKTLTNKMVVIK